MKSNTADFLRRVDQQINRNRNIWRSQQVLIAASYIVFSVMWELFSRRVISLLFQHSALEQTIMLDRGWAFLAVTAIFVALYAKYYHTRPI